MSDNNTTETTPAKTATTTDDAPKPRTRKAPRPRGCNRAYRKPRTKGSK